MAKPPKVTSPIRSSGRRETNRANSSLTASSLVLGLSRNERSSACMEPETSTAIWMAMTSERRVDFESAVCGRASAMMASAMPASHMIGTRLAIQTRQPDERAGSHETGEKRSALTRRGRSRTMAAAARGRKRSKASGC